MELTELADDSPLWREVCSTRETRIGPRCPHHAECFVTRARQEASAAQLIVVNHHLYFADLATRLRGGAILPRHDVVVFDEAHLIEDTATEFFSVHASSARVNRLLDDCLAAVRAARIADDPAEGRRADLAGATRAAAGDLFGRFRGPQGRAPLHHDELTTTQIAAHHRLDSALEALTSTLRQLEHRDENIDHCTVRCQSLRDDLEAVLGPTRKDFVHWVDNRARSVIVGASPIDVSNELREGVFLAVPTSVLTSATLSTEGSFAFLRSRLGIDFDSVELSVPSPFDYEQQACLFLPQHLPDPRDAEFIDQAAPTIRELVAISGGGALVLCTSKKNMRTVHALLDGSTEGPLLLQGQAPKSALVASFLQDHRSVLCATASFWQGVDLPGDALRLVIIDKLPFASPGDPLVAARIDHLREAGQRPFTVYQVPAAVLALKQGFGRLIRTRHDRGIVAVLDRRLTTMPYGRSFVTSLPRCARAERLEEVRQWWEGTTHR